MIAKRLNDLLVRLSHLERRADPYFRESFDRVLQRPLANLVQRRINRRRQDEGLGLAEERLLPGEEQATREIIRTMAEFTLSTYPTGFTLRAGNTKTYGVVRGTFEVLPGLKPNLARGLFREPRSYPVWVRFGGPGPLAPPDLEDNGVLSIGIKVMGVPGAKLFDDERFTQDFTGISAPTFTTPNVIENVKLQRHVLAGTPLLYFIDPRDSHLLDLVMQGLWAKTHANPLQARYYSCVAYLLGEGQAMHYSISPRGPAQSKVPRRPSDDYLREAMALTLSERDAEFDFSVQVQTDPHRMPIENASVEWPERLSPFVPVARLVIPAQRFDSQAQLTFGENLSYNPWHSIPDHRPLGNQNRARRHIYFELSNLRHHLNAAPRLEPTGDEVFAASAGASR